jgi:hypothetical protein
VTDAALVIRDGHVAYPGPVAGAPVPPPDAAKIDAGGGTLPAPFAARDYFA